MCTERRKWGYILGVGLWIIKIRISYGVITSQWDFTHKVKGKGTTLSQNVLHFVQLSFTLTPYP